MIDLTTDIAKANILLSHIKNGAPKAINSALNRTIEGVRTDITKQVTSTYDIKAKPVRASMKITKSTLSTLQASAAGAGSPIPLINFHVTPNKPGQQNPGSVLRASVKKSGGLPIPGAFVAKVGNHVGIFRRVDKRRFPIMELYGPATPQMMNEVKIRQQVMDGANERFGKRLDHEIDRLLAKE
jgi:hypothetical protein